MFAIELFSLLLCAPLLVIDGVFATEVLLGVPAARARPMPPVPARIVVVVPAHDEEGGVQATIEAIRQSIGCAATVLVVAHNCSDGTAAAAAAAGARVVEVDRPDLRGKGFALAGGRDALADDPPDAVVLIDADCVPQPGTIERLAGTALVTGRAVQGSYVFRTGPADPPMVAVSNFAILIKNLVRQRGGWRLGAPALMTGSGMALPWATFARLDLATGNIVEDLAMGIELSIAGEAPVFEPLATVWSTPSSQRGTLKQRQRWESGFLGTARHVAPRLFALGLRRGHAGLIWLGLHLFTPPLTLLLAVNAAVLAGFALIGADGGALLPLALITAAVSLMLLALVWAWLAEGRQTLPAAALARAPLYLLWKAGLYLRILRPSQRTGWERTDRVN